MFIAIIALFIAGCGPAPAVQEDTPVPPSEPEELPTVEEVAAEEPEKEIVPAAEYQVELRASGFTPRLLRVPLGETVTFVNMESKPRWIASNVHPIHAVYPGSNINKCDTDEESKIFDACHDLEQGEEFSFTFTKTGTWGYHDHRQPSIGGTIIVE